MIAPPSPGGTVISPFAAFIPAPAAPSLHGGTGRHPACLGGLDQR